MRFVCEAPARLDAFLAQHVAGFSRTRLVELIVLGLVLVDGKPRKPSFRLESGMVVTVESLPQERPPHDLTPAEIPLNVVFEDLEFLIVDKPRGMAVHPAPTLREPSLVNALLARNTPLSASGEAFRPGIVHRLDKETTGLVVVAKTDQAHYALARQFQTKAAKRTYLAVVKGDFQRESATIEAPIGRDPRNRQRMAVDPKGKPAVTHIRLLRRLAEGSLLECRLETGRTHQIRVHLAAVGHPILGDKVYGDKRGAQPMQLHAAELELTHPVTKKPMKWAAPTPKDFVVPDFVVS